MGEPGGRLPAGKGPPETHLSASSKKRQSRAERIRPTALFAIASEALASPHGDVWVDNHGERAASRARGMRWKNRVNNLGNNPGESS